ncbi:MAG TPA: hypothetical protein VF857_01870 [Spirochaetota bacterium]
MRNKTAKPASLFITLIMLFIGASPLFADEWVPVRTIPGGTIPAYGDSGNVVITGFADEQNGIAISVPADVHYTRDGGTTWTYAVVPEITYLNSLEILDSSHAWVISGLETRYTNNGGKSWNELPRYGAIYAVGHYISFIDPLNGWYGICHGGTVPQLANTVDGGRNWIPIPTPPQATEDSIWAINRVDRDTGYLLLYDGSIFRTDNNGSTWKKAGRIPTGKRILENTTWGTINSAFRFSDKLHGSAILLSLKPRGYVSFSTSDGGASWIEDSLPEQARSFCGSIFLSCDRRILTITDLENGSAIIFKRKEK